MSEEVPNWEGHGQVASAPTSPMAPLEGAAHAASSRPTPLGAPGTKTVVAGGASPVLATTHGSTLAASAQSSPVGGWAGCLTPNWATQGEIIAFAGIPDPVSEGRRMSCRLQDQPDVDDMQLRCAMRAAKLRDIEVTTDMSVNTSNSIQHFPMMQLFIMQIS